MFTGTDFWLWGNQVDAGYRHMAWKSSDGVNWSGQPTFSRRPDAGSGGAVSFGPVAFGAATFVAASNDAYGSQNFYRSVDGVTWDLLPRSAFVGSHPIRNLTFGFAERSPACP